MEGTIWMVAHLRSGGEITGDTKSIADFSEEQIVESLEEIGRFVREVKNMTYLSLKVEGRGQAIVHPDDISYLEVCGSTSQLRELIEKCI